MFLKRILILLLSLALLPGCMTRQLWRDELPQYDETVSSVLIAKDQQHVVFIGQRYHYVFQDMPGLPELIRSPLAARMDWSQSGACTFSPDQLVRCTMVLSVASLTPDEAQEGERIGLKDGKITLRLVGKRYAPVAMPADQVTALRHTYHVSVRGTEPEDRTVERLLKSPVTVAADGVLLLVGVPLLALSKLLGGSWR